MRLPGVCFGCGEPVVWTGKRWRDPGQRRGVHADGCRICGALMPQIKERCARRRGHADCHRSRYDLDNQARQRRSGFAA
jgi:hypothetical protein